MATSGTEKFVGTLALTLALSPEEREQQSRDSGFVDDCPANPVTGIRVRQRRILLLLSLPHRMGEGGRRLGEGMVLAGMREVVLQTFRSRHQREDAKTPRRKEKMKTLFALRLCALAPLR